MEGIFMTPEAMAAAVAVLVQAIVATIIKPALSRSGREWRLRLCALVLGPVLGFLFCLLPETPYNAVTGLVYGLAGFLPAGTMWLGDAAESKIGDGPRFPGPPAVAGLLLLAFILPFLLSGCSSPLLNCYEDSVVVLYKQKTSDLSARCSRQTGVPAVPLATGDKPGSFWVVCPEGEQLGAVGTEEKLCDDGPCIGHKVGCVTASTTTATGPELEPESHAPAPSAPDAVPHD